MIGDLASGGFQAGGSHEHKGVCSDCNHSWKEYSLSSYSSCPKCKSFDIERFINGRRVSEIENERADYLERMQHDNAGGMD